jgi:hypothetical protein
MFVTASPYAHDARVTGGIPFIEIPSQLERDREAHHAWLRALIRDVRAERLIADAFPAGIQGELSGLPIAMDYVARILRVDEYLGVASEIPQFETTWVMEELSPEHEELVRTWSERVGTPASGRLMPAASRAAAWVGAAAGRRRHQPARTPAFPWLIAHSGPAEEVTELIEYTQTLLEVENEKPERILVATRCDLSFPANFERIDIYPLTHLFETSARIISAAGFNVMHETEPWMHKHDVIPFPRRFDDQYLRAARRKAKRNLQ